MEAEPLHHRLRRFSLVASAAIYEPVDFDGGELLEAFEEVGYGSVLDRDDEFVEVDECYPSGVEAVAFQTVVVCGKLSSVARPVDILDNTLLDVRFENLLCAVGALVVVDVELVYALRQVPLYLFLEVGTFVLGNGADSQIMLRCGMVSAYVDVQLYGVEHAETQDATPLIACHLVRDYSCYDFS